MTDHNQEVGEAIAQTYDVERATVDAAIDKAVAGQVNALLCVGIDLSPEQLPADPADPAGRRGGGAAGRRGGGAAGRRGGGNSSSVRLVST